MDTEISIKDFKFLELDDENKLEEESNFLINYDNDLIIAHLSSDSITKQKDLQNPNDINNDLNYKNNNNEIKGKIVNPIFNSKVNLIECPDNFDNFDNFGSESNKIYMEINKKIPDTPTLLKEISLEKYNNNNEYKSKSKSNSNSNEKENKNINIINDKYINKNKTPINNLNYSTIKNYYDETLQLDFNSNLSNFLNKKNKNNNKNNYKNNKNNENNNLSRSFSPNLKSSKKNVLNNSFNNKKNLIPNLNLSRSTNQNDSKLNYSNFSYKSNNNIDQERIKINLTMAAISNKIMKLKEYQKSLIEKINEKEVEKNKLLKNKNEEIIYIKKNANENVKNLKSLQSVIDKNKEIMETSQKMINDLKKELKNKSKDLYVNCNDIGDQSRYISGNSISKIFNFIINI
jgi:hypothetical protein